MIILLYNMYIIIIIILLCMIVQDNNIAYHTLHVMCMCVVIGVKNMTLYIISWSVRC